MHRSNTAPSQRGRPVGWMAVALTSGFIVAGCGESTGPGSGVLEAASRRPATSSQPPATISTTSSATSTTLRATTATTIRATTTTQPDPCAAADIEAGTRLASGLDIGQGQTGGSSQLEIENGSSLDATVKLIAGDAIVRHVFVRKSESATAYGLPSGSFRLLVSQGTIWDAERHQFQCDRRAFEFVEGAEFSESSTSYSVLSITLQPVPSGNATTKSISVDAFNQAGN